MVDETDNSKKKASSWNLKAHPSKDIMLILLSNLSHLNLMNDYACLTKMWMFNWLLFDLL